MINVISIHGVRASQGENSWQVKLCEYIKKCGRSDIRYISYSYGWIPAFYSILPFLQRFYTNKFRKWLEQQNLTGKTYIIAHSFGSFIAFHALKEKIDK